MTAGKEGRDELREPPAMPPVRLDRPTPKRLRRSRIPHMTRQQLIERILFAVDGYRFGEWSLPTAVARITKLIEDEL